MHLLEQDPMSRVACETCTNTGFVLVMGEITSKANVDYEAIVRKTVKKLDMTISIMALTQTNVRCLLTLTSSQKILLWVWTRH